MDEIMGIMNASIEEIATAIKEKEHLTKQEDDSIGVIAENCAAAYVMSMDNMLSAEEMKRRFAALYSLLSVVGIRCFTLGRKTTIVKTMME